MPISVLRTSHCTYVDVDLHLALKLDFKRFCKRLVVPGIGMQYHKKDSIHKFRPVVFKSSQKVPN